MFCCDLHVKKNHEMLTALHHKRLYNRSRSEKWDKKCTNRGLYRLVYSKLFLDLVPHKWRFGQKTEIYLKIWLLKFTLSLYYKGSLPEPEQHSFCSVCLRQIIVSPPQRSNIHTIWHCFQQGLSILKVNIYA